MDDLKQLRKKLTDLEQNERLFKETEKKLQAANQQLQTNEQQLKSKQETLIRTQKIAHVGSWDWDVASDMVSWSDELFQIFRLNPEKGAISYADHPKIYTPESMQLLDAAVRKALETGEPYEIDLKIIRGDGTNAFCTARGMAKKNEKGKVVQLFGSFQDITERKNAEGHLSALNQQLLANEQQLRAANQQLQANEQQLKAANQQLRANEQQLRAANESLIASEKKFRNLFNSMQEGLYLHQMVYDNQGNAINYRIIEANPVSEKYLNIKTEDAIGKLATELFNTKEAPLLDIYAKVAETGDPVSFEQYFEPMKKYFLISVFSPAKGNFATVFLDITEKKLTEISLNKTNEELKRTQEITHTGSFSIDLTTNEVIWTEELYKIFGFDPTLPPPLLNESNMLFTSESWVLFSNSIANAAENGVPYEIELKTQLKDGSNGWMWVLGAPIVNADGRITEIRGAVQDISERKDMEIELLKAKEKAEESEKALKHSHDLMKYIIEHNRSAVAVHDKNFRYIYVSEKYLEDYKVKEKDIIGKHHYDVFPDLPQKWRDAHKRALLGEILSADDDPYYKDDGTVEWTRWECRPWYENDNSIGGFIVYTEVITERKKMELALRKAKKKAEESEEKIRQIFENSTIVHYAHDLDHVVYYMSPHVVNVLGYTPEELKVKWTSLISDNPINEEAYKNTIKAIETGKKQEAYQIEFVHKNGKKVLVEAHEAPVVKDGKTISIVGSFADITERNKLEKIKDILVAISNKILTTNNLEEFFHHIFIELSKIVETNNFYIALYDEQSEMISTPYIADKLDTDITEFPAKRTMTGHVIKTRKSMFINQDDFRELVKSGTIDLVGPPSDVWIGVPLFSLEKVIGAIVIQNYEGEKRLGKEDLRVLEYVAPQISLAIERKKVVEDLKHALEKAQEADRLKSAFLANMSHEIRTPMNGILGFTDLLKEPKLTGPERKKYIQVIENSGQRLLSTVNDLIDISKIESGQMKVSVSEFDINHLNEELFTFFNEEAKKKDLQLFLSRSSLTNAIILSDKEKIYSILTNLIKNAIKYTQHGSIDFGYQKKGDELQFFVKDTGNGIPKDQLNAIFDRFIRNDSSDAIFTEGSGLGLSISKAYVEMLGGKIWVESEVGVGSQFYFTIPFTKESRLAENMENITLPKSKSHINPEISGLKILIAEDDETAANLLSILVKDISTEIIQTNSGIEAIELCQKNPDIDVILMDIQMPGNNGYEATRKIREFNKEVVIIAQTAFALSGDQEKSIEAGCNDYIKKPINKTELLEKIEKCVGR